MFKKMLTFFLKKYFKYRIKKGTWVVVDKCGLSHFDSELAVSPRGTFYHVPSEVYIRLEGVQLKDGSTYVCELPKGTLIITVKGDMSND